MYRILKIRTGEAVCFVFALVSVGMIFANRLYLADEIVAAWGIHGEPLGSIRREAVSIAFAGIFCVLFATTYLASTATKYGPSMPKAVAAYNRALVGLAAFFAVNYLQVLAWNCGIKVNFPKIFVLSCASLMFLGATIIVKAEHSWFVAIKNRWTLGDARIWTHTHVFCTAWCIAGAALSLLVLVSAYTGIYILVASIIFLYPLAVLYSYVEHRRGAIRP